MPRIILPLLRFGYFVAIQSNVKKYKGKSCYQIGLTHEQKQRIYDNDCVMDCHAPLTMTPAVQTSGEEFPTYKNANNDNICIFRIPTLALRALNDGRWLPLCPFTYVEGEQ